MNLFFVMQKKRKNLIGQELIFFKKYVFARKTEEVDPQIQFLLRTTQLPLNLKNFLIKFRQKNT